MIKVELHSRKYKMKIYDVCFVLILNTHVLAFFTQH